MGICSSKKKDAPAADDESLTPEQKEQKAKEKGASKDVDIELMQQEIDQLFKLKFCFLELENLGRVRL
jgi:hypothetical protein